MDAVYLDGSVPLDLWHEYDMKEVFLFVVNVHVVMDGED